MKKQSSFDKYKPDFQDYSRNLENAEVVKSRRCERGHSQERLPADPVPEMLREFFRLHEEIALAFSGGVDSAYLLYAARACQADVRAYYVSTPFQPAFELADAKRLAKELSADLRVLPFDILEDPAVAANPQNRCYYCKTRIFSAIRQAAAADGYSVLLDGTNASDDAGDRPGMRALAELSVLSPLRLCGLTKPQIREYSKKAGLFTWNKPAYACLATRVPSGTAIDADILTNVEWAENALFQMGFSDFRVRVLPVGAQPLPQNAEIRQTAPQKAAESGKAAKGSAPVSAVSPAVVPAPAHAPAPAVSRSFCARLQFPEAQLPLLLARRAEILALLKSRFEAVFLDLETRG